MKATNEKEFEKKAMRAIKDRAKYVQRKIGILENKVKELKSELRKSSKKKKIVLKLKETKLKAEVKLLKVEQLSLRETLTLKK